MFNGESSLNQIISFRFQNIQDTLVNDYNRKLDFGNILDIITSNNDIDDKIVKPLLRIRKSFDKKSDTEDIKFLIDKIEDTIELINRKEEILAKYSFEELTKDVITKDFRSDAYYGKLNINKDNELELEEDIEK